MLSPSRLRLVVRRGLSAILERLRLKRFARTAVRTVRAPGVPKVQPKVVRVLQHDPLVHTQGLAYAEGHLYESTGLVAVVWVVHSFVRDNVFDATIASVNGTAVPATAGVFTADVPLTGTTTSVIIRATVRAEPLRAAGSRPH